VLDADAIGDELSQKGREPYEQHTDDEAAAAELEGA